MHNNLPQCQLKIFCMFASENIKPNENLIFPIFVLNCIQNSWDFCHVIRMSLCRLFHCNMMHSTCIRCVAGYLRFYDVPEKAAVLRKKNWYKFTKSKEILRNYNTSDALANTLAGCTITIKINEKPIEEKIRSVNIMFTGIKYD